MIFVPRDTPLRYLQLKQKSQSINSLAHNSRNEIWVNCINLQTYITSLCMSRGVRAARVYICTMLVDSDSGQPVSRRATRSSRLLGLGPYIIYVLTPASKLAMFALVSARRTFTLLRTSACSFGQIFTFLACVLKTTGGTGCFFYKFSSFFFLLREL